jgi:hypothetical protein
MFISFNGLSVMMINGIGFPLLHADQDTRALSPRLETVAWSQNSG